MLESFSAKGQHACLLFLQWTLNKDPAPNGINIIQPFHGILPRSHGQGRLTQSWMRQAHAHNLNILVEQISCGLVKVSQFIENKTYLIFVFQGYSVRMLPDQEVCFAMKDDPNALPTEKQWPNSSDKVMCPCWIFIKNSLESMFLMSIFIVGEEWDHESFHERLANLQSIW